MKKRRLKKKVKKILLIIISYINVYLIIMSFLLDERAAAAFAIMSIFAIEFIAILKYKNINIIINK